MGNVQSFFSRCEEALALASRMENPLLIYHYDCDGIACGSIIAGWLESLKKPYDMLSVRKLDEELAQSLGQRKELILADVGSGSAFLEQLKGDVLIIDHHQPAHKAHLQANPHLFGFDGGSELSAAGCAYFVFRQAVDLGIVGAVGDIQQPFCSLNRLMLEEAVRQGAAAISTDLLLFGKNSRPLIQFLEYADEPYIPGISGNRENCIRLLSELGIELKENENWRTYYDLKPDEKRRLVSALADYVSLRVSPEAACQLTGEVISLSRRQPHTELCDASEFSTLLNACGRNGQPQLGVAVCLSRPGAYEKAQALLAEHRRNLRDGISFAAQNIQDLGKFLFLDARGVIADSIIGVVAGMLFIGQREKPILAISLDESGKIKLSARATRKLVRQGLNLGKILSESSLAVGGVGGGHNIAAGATIPPERLDEFLLEFSKRL
ncbi:MAG: DHH family phosphoesterase [Candidatus Micrarchaeota archaeon]|nr:DHH family phosphoesterase [Candidatus Micrarchaeota archaeon]